MPRRLSSKRPCFIRIRTGHFDKVTSDQNKGLKERRKLTKRSHVVPMVGKLFSDMFAQDKYLLNGVRVKLSRSRNEFSLMVAKTEDVSTTPYKASVTLASMFVRKCELNPAVMIGHAKALEKATAKYPISRVVLNVFSTAQGQHYVIQDHLFLIQLPKRIIVGAVDLAAFNGQYDKSPFEFKHYNINFLAMYLDGDQIPTKALTPDFANSRYMRSYFSLFTGTGTAWKDMDNTISPEDYAKGYTLFDFDLSPSLTDGDQVELLKTGSLRLEIGFGEPLPEPIHVLVYGELDGMIEINKARQVMVDFAG